VGAWDRRPGIIAAALVTAFALGGCKATSSTSDGGASDDPWQVVADERGFTEALEGKDFFAVAHYGCDVDTTEPPHTVEALAEEADLIALGSIVEIVPSPEQPPSDESITEEIRLRVEIAEVVKGASEGSILVLENCGTGGKVAPLRDRIPDESFLFFLDGPAPRGAEREPVFHLMYYHLGIVAETADGVRFALDVTRSSPSLAEFDSLEAVMDVVLDKTP
jgi:hypothetical protein